MVDAGAYPVLMLVEGKGSPAVVFISGGFGGPLDADNKVSLKVRKFVRTVVYQRGGIGKSEPAPPPRDSKHVASELHTALRNAGVAPPYILVGASLGGIHARVFAHMYPADVAGLACRATGSVVHPDPAQAGSASRWNPTSSVEI